MHEPWVPDASLIPPSHRRHRAIGRGGRFHVIALALCLIALAAVAHASRNDDTAGLAFSTTILDAGSKVPAPGEQTPRSWRHLLLLITGLGAGLLAVATCASQRLAPATAPIFALFAGVFLGDLALSWDEATGGILALRTGLLTMVVVVATLLLYAARVTSAAPTLRRIVPTLAALTGTAYAGLLLTGSDLAADTLPELVLGLSAATAATGNLVLDFDFIERGAHGRLPAGTEWYGAFGLMVSAVWLFLALLPILA